MKLDSIALSRLIRKHTEEWTSLRSDITPTAASVNNGYCSDFRHGLLEDMKIEPGLSTLDPGDICMDDLDLKDAKPTTPEGVDWDFLTSSRTEMRGLSLIDCLCHSWLFVEGRHYDCESPEGEASPFDLPCLRRALVSAVVTFVPGEWKRLESFNWWIESRLMLESFIDENERWLNRNTLNER